MNGNIPILSVVGKSIAETWEKSLIQLHHYGNKAKTQYDAEGDSPSIDATMMMIILEPDSEPAIHRCFPGGLEDLEEYRLEVLEGIKDHWIDVDDDSKWSYTYHERLRKYGCYHKITEIGAKGFKEVLRRYIEIDQIKAMCQALAKNPHSRRVQAITWQVWHDPQHLDPPCLQRIWCRIIPNDDGEWVLNMNLYFRSRDAYKAAFMNMWAFCGHQGLQGLIADKITVLSGHNVRCGRYVDTSDSYHIYGKDIPQFEKEFLSQYKKRDFADRTWTRKFAESFFAEAHPQIYEKIREYDERSSK